MTAYALTEGIDRFQSALLGADDGDGEVVTVRVLLDGRLLETRTVAPGSSQDLAVVTTGGAELVIEAVSPNGQQWYLGDPRLLGTEQATDRLAQG